ncbi:hypothetical protein ADK75_07575 [Streptomyces virginiae]|uniref:Uncharacterized protein n=1 Tax=Streptomyces virginiae TaxID=1961 RepID=A0A0L8N1E6_STRVG|nr:hypothetical protein [Streptomyces virginiae]KOG56413.1 hypothetical protein ADK75_07575 [Streptomyces virginiae]
MSRTRGTWNSKGIWAAGVALAAVLVLTAYSMLAGGDDGADAPAKSGASASPGATGAASPAPTYAAPADWTEPERWTALPRGQRTDDRGSQVGFPHTVEGAAAMAAAASATRIEGETSTTDEQLRIYHSYMGKSDQTAENAKKIDTAGQQADAALSQEMGVSAGQPLPSGAYVRGTVVGYKVVKKAADEVSVWLLTRVVQKTGETKQEDGSYTRTLLGVQWQDGDWKLTAAATSRAQQDVAGDAQPPMVAPGDAEFNTGGWTAIREAS